MSRAGTRSRTATGLLLLALDPGQARGGADQESATEAFKVSAETRRRTLPGACGEARVGGEHAQLDEDGGERQDRHLRRDGSGRILETRVSIREGARVALLHLDHRSLGRFYTWSNQYGGTAAARRADEALVGDLRASPSIGDAAYLPSLLLPPKRSVPRLREAAARFQCDLLFVYATDCQVYRQYRFFTADEAKARCSAEAALLDVRTGVVPFTAKAEEEFVLEKGDDDAGFAETLERSEAAASQAAVRSAAGSLVDFLAASRR